MSKVVGIDVSKAHLDVSVAGGTPRRFANTEEGIAILLAGLVEQDILRVVYEPTGGYELPLAQALGQAGLPGHRVHPNRAPAYAQAGGLLAKTDRLDAQVLAHYGAAFDCPEPSLGADEPGPGRTARPAAAAGTAGTSAGAGTEPAGQGALLRGRRLRPAPHRLAGRGDRPTGRRVPGPAVGQPSPVPAGRAVPERTRHRPLDRGHPGGGTARTGPVRREGPGVPERVCDNGRYLCSLFLGVRIG